ncbi:MAG: diacylglycerol/lipid kinase family protein [Candidatus Methylomirabilia bacterium]
MSTLPAVQLVVNPTAGNGKGFALAKELEASLRASGRDVRTLVVRGRLEARAWVERCRGDFGYLFCVGGDETLSEVAPLALRRDVPLVPVPVGFGNMFARTFGYRSRIPSLLNLLEHGEVRRVDVGIDRGGVFLSSQSFGFLEEVKQAVEDRVAVPHSGLLRYLAYVQTALRMIKTAALPSIRVEVEGELITDQAAMAIVANVPTYAGFLSLTPTATPLDGLLDVFVVPPMAKRALVSLLLAFLFRLPGRWQGVCYRQGKRVSVTTPAEEAEQLGVLPRVLPILTPPGPHSTSRPRTGQTDPLVALENPALRHP